MRLNDVLTIIGLSLISETINIPKAYSKLFSECPGQSVPKIRQQSNQTELYFIFYYVSWCPKSRAAKRVYKEVAKHYDDHINFVAINCGHMECDCSNMTTPVPGNTKGFPPEWPTLLVRYGQRIQMPVHYSDEWKFGLLARFINNLCHPVVRLHGEDELKLLSLHSYGLVLGLFPNASVSDYRKFTFAAVKSLEKDPKRELRYAVALGAVAEDIMRTLNGSMSLIYLIKDEKYGVFNRANNWSVKKLALWADAKSKALEMHYYPFSEPSILARYMRKGPALIIFVDDLKNQNNNFYVQMELSLARVGIETAKPNLSQCEHFLSIDESDLAEKTCPTMPNRESKQVTSAQSSCSAEPREHKDLLGGFPLNAQQKANYACSAKNIFQRFKHTECLQYINEAGAGTAELRVFIAKMILEIIKDSFGKHTGTNNKRSMSLHIMDARKYRGLMRQLGVANFEKPPPTTLLIIEPKKEVVYVTQKPFHDLLLMLFIQEYYDGSLQMERKSNVISEKTLENQKYDKQLREVNRHSLLNGIRHEWRDTTTVLLLYSPLCAISWQMSHALLQALKMFERSQHYKHRINFIRLNTQTNDLPCELKMTSVPSLIVFPRGQFKKFEIFPSNLKIDVRNIFGFILAQFKPLEQVHAALETCTLPRSQLLKCLVFVKTLTTQHNNDRQTLLKLDSRDREIIKTPLMFFKHILKLDDLLSIK